MVGRVVVLRALKLGDFLVAVPALRAIRRAWPGHEIVLATHGWLRPIMELATCVDGVLATRGRGWLPRWVARPEVPVPGAVVIHPGAAYASKRWPVEQVLAAARELLEEES